MYALVTGASAGIGKEVARYLAELGYDLILTARTEEKLQMVRRAILKRYPERSILLIPADLSKREDCFRLHREVCEQAGRENIGFVANNAGMGVYGPFLETDLEKELQLIDLNVASVHILSKLFLRDMKENGHGVLMNVGSCAGFMSGPTFSSYYASKNYVVRLTEAIHEELRREKKPGQNQLFLPGACRHRLQPQFRRCRFGKADPPLPGGKRRRERSAQRKNDRDPRSENAACCKSIRPDR